MRMLELEVHNIRGIRHLLLRPNGKNFVIWGPNGSGKSAVVDAIDFLLTGRISRLIGKGTGNITLGRHGPHIDHKVSEAMVRAVVQLSHLKDPIEIKRCMARSEFSAYDETSKDMTLPLKPIIALASRGQHVLTRRDILKFITSEAGTRAWEIQELLNIIEIETIRKTLVKVLNSLAKDSQIKKHAADTARGSVNSTAEEKVFCEDRILRVVNKYRTELGGKPISILHSARLKAELRPPTSLSSTLTMNFTLFEKYIRNLHDLLSVESQVQIHDNDQQLRDLIKTIRYDPQMLHAFARLQLIELGIELIDETGNCPLCGAPWPPGKLYEYLENRLSTSRIAAKYYEEIRGLASTIVVTVHSTIASVQEVIRAAQDTNLIDDLRILRHWLGNLRELVDALNAVTEKYPDSRFGMDQVQKMFAPADLPQILARVEAAAKLKYPEIPPEQNAWDTLTRLEENLKALENARTSYERAELRRKKANILLECFLKARDNVLGKLYDEIRDRFVDLYRQLHKLDEDKFGAKIELEEAGLNFEVDFYGRGAHPPHALHSEGHQDSMGLCLYLALNEYLNKGLIDLIILDDVVMSVDIDHRRQICHLLATSFPNRQFLITTHDRTWANQLKSEGVVTSRTTVEFYNWNIETGPQVNNEIDMWRRIEEDLEKNDIPSAAARLRRGAEEFFRTVCDALHVKVVYKLNGRWELGDFLPEAMRQYRKLLKQAKKTAQSWGNEDCFKMLQESDEIMGSIYTRSGAEQWAINANVHYNNWANFSQNDFRPVLEAFQDLFDLFICSKCSGMLYLSTTKDEPVAIRCKCGKVDWNLIKKDFK